MPNFTTTKFFSLFSIFVLVSTMSLSAQETTSSVRGTVVDGAGNAVAGASVNILHEPSGSVSSRTTNSDGLFVAANLRVGGPYKISASSGSLSTSLDGVFLQLADTKKVSLVLADFSGEELVVTASRTDSVGLKAGVQSNISADDIAGIASVNRDLRDAIATQPFVNLYSISYENDDSESISIAGQPVRYSGFSVDGISVGDDFGLNYSGYPTLRSPLSLDSVEQVSVSVVDYDVRDTGSTSGTVNVVTKSGTNEFEGSIYNFSTDNDDVGDEIDGQKRTIGNFKEDTIGFTLSGPIIKDKLFFFVNYDDFEKTQPGLYGAAGSGALVEVRDVPLSVANEVIDIAKSVWNYDAGSAIGQNNTLIDEDRLYKIDWNIDDNHRLTMTKQQSINNDIREYGGSFTRLALTSSNYMATYDLEANSYQLFSDWTDQLSTVIRYGEKELDTSQQSVGGDDFMRTIILLEGNEDGPQILLGPDPFRHYNFLNNDSRELSLELSYLTGNHEIVAGWSRNQVIIENGFVAYSDAELTFDSVADFASKTPSIIDYRNSPSGDPANGASFFDVITDSIYMQDTWDVSDRLTINYGFRHEEISMDDAPRFNESILAAHGIRNDTSLDGKSVFLPRFSFRYEAGDFGYFQNVTFRGGAGFFAGGRPNVWMSGTFSNDGIGIQNANVPLAAAADFDGYNTDPWNQYIYGPTHPSYRPAYADILDPNFDLPKERKMSIGADWVMGDGYYFSADYLVTQVIDEVFIQGLRIGNPAFAKDLGSCGVYTNEPIGTAIDGRDVYVGSYSGSCGRARESAVDYMGYDMLLTNTSLGESTLFSISVSKDFENGWDAYANYTIADVEIAGVNSSSRNISNFKYNPKLTDWNTPVLHRSPYSRDDTWSLVANYRANWFNVRGVDAPSRFTFILNGSSGEPYGFTYAQYQDMAVWGLDREKARDDSAVFYVAEDSDDVGFMYGFEADYNEAMRITGLDQHPQGEYTKIYGRTTGDNVRLDFKFTQELPGFGLTEKDKFVITLDIENFLNFLDSEWGKQTKGRSSNVKMAEVRPRLRDDGTYTYDYLKPYGFSLDNLDNEQINYYRSLYRIQLGVKYQF